MYIYIEFGGIPRNEINTGFHYCEIPDIVIVAIYIFLWLRGDHEAILYVNTEDNILYVYTFWSM